MVQAGPGTDATIQALLPHLDKGDILIDGGNTFYKDTIRRNEELANSGINFIGTGVSGGEKGALEGPSIMPGGQKEAYDLVAFCDQLHITILDPVMDHFYVVTSSIRTDVSHTWFSIFRRFCRRHG